MTGEDRIRASEMSDPERTIPLHQMAKTSSVTYRMLLAHLRSCEFIAAPERLEGSFRWAVDATDPSTEDDTTFQKNLIFICPAEYVEDFLSEVNLPLGSLIVVCSQDGSVPEGLPARSVVVRQEKEYLYYVKQIQGLFLALWLWEMELGHIAYSGDKRGQRGRLQKMANAGFRFAPEFLCITDTGFNLIAYSKNVPAPSTQYEALVEEGCYRKEMISFLRKEVLSKVGPRSSIVVCAPNDLCPYYSIHKPLFIDGAYVFHLTMVTKQTEGIEALKDFFAIMAAYFTALCTEFWNSHLEVESSCHKVLIGMIEKKVMSSRYINTQLEETLIPETNCFRLARYHIDYELSYDQSREALTSANDLFPNHCYPFMYHDDLIVLICSPTNNLAGISLKKTLNRTRTAMYEPYGLACALSQPFRSIQDIAFAYQQTDAAFRCERQLKAQYPDGYDGEGNFPIIPFEHTLQFILVDGSIDPEMYRIIFANSIVALLSEEDRKQSGEFTKLLWEYLCAECNATEVAKKLNMHRNTVVYHINKFEKRFDVSLDPPMVRHRLYLDFVHYFSQSAR